MKNHITSFFICMILLSASQAGAYEVSTHEKISATAAGDSVLVTDRGLLPSLGLQYSIDNRKQSFPNSEGLQETILKLITDGANFEDSGIRSLNHFYDPTTDSALIPIISFTSPTWALEDKGQIPFLQDYSFDDAEDYFYNALTQEHEVDRDTYFGKMFETLGHVIHHLQDMAQPQHVRLDKHCDTNVCKYLNNLFPGLYNPSGFEKWALAHGDTLSFTGYDSVYPWVDPTVFDTPRKFWATTGGYGNSGYGIAEYTNRGFFSAGTNVDSGKYAEPAIDPAAGVTVDITDLCYEADATGRPPCSKDSSGNVTLSGTMTFFGNIVTDTLRPSNSMENPRATTYSLFDQDLIKKAATPVYSLNRFNFDYDLGFLIPRAVGYSAGLINYFFRGKMDILPVTNGQYVIKNLSEYPMSGTFELYYNDMDGNRLIVPGASWSLTIAANDESPPLSVTLPAPSDKYMLVFHGALGVETNTVVGRSVSDEIVGVNITESGSGTTDRAYIWTEFGGMVPLGIPGDSQSDVYGGSAISADGSVIVGNSTIKDPDTGVVYSVPVRWASSGSFTVLSSLAADSDSSAFGVSPDGAISVGVGVGNYSYHAVQWTETGNIIMLGELPGDINSMAFGVSTDGAAIVGRSIDPNGEDHAVLWVDNGGIISPVPLGPLPGDTESDAYAISADGTTIVGYSGNFSLPRIQAVRWTITNGTISPPIALGTLDGYPFSTAYGISADGTVIVGGLCDDSACGEGFKWTNSTGMVLLGAGGVATAISADGTEIAGGTYSGPAFRMRDSGIVTLGILDYTTGVAILPNK